MRKHVERFDGIEIEKKESDVPKEVLKARKVNKGPIRIQATDVIQTAISYQMPSVGISPSEHGSECRVCGEKTSVDNRHFCVECWKKYKDELLGNIQSELEDFEFEIE